MPKFFQPGRSRPRHHRAANVSWDAGGFENFAENGFGLLGFFLCGNVARAHDDAVREHGNDQTLKIVGQAIIAAFEKRARLGGSMQHHGAARAHAQAQLFGLARALNNLERVIEQALFHLYMRYRFLHRENVRGIHHRRDRFHRRMPRIVA
jgi:hypothetical protein